MLVSVIALALMQTTPVDSGDRNLRVTELYEPYVVPGRDYRQFSRNINRNSPLGVVFGYGYYINTEFSFEYMSRTTCELASIYVYLDHNYSVPRWSGYNRASDEDKAEYDDFYQAEEADLMRTSTFTQGAAMALLTDLRSLGEMNCDDVQTAARKVADSWIVSVNRAIRTLNPTSTPDDLMDDTCERAGALLPRCSE